MTVRVSVMSVATTGDAARNQPEPPIARSPMSTETGLNVTAPIATSRPPIERNDQVRATATDRSSRCFRQSPISRTGRAPNQVPGWRGWRKATARDPQAGRPHWMQESAGTAAPCSRTSSEPLTNRDGAGAKKAGLSACGASGGTGTITLACVAGTGEGVDSTFDSTAGFMNREGSTGSANFQHRQVTKSPVLTFR